MNTAIANENPFYRTFRCDHAFAWEKISLQARSQPLPLKVLDYGTHDGKMLLACLDSGLPIDAYGVDANVAAIARGRGDIQQDHSLRLAHVDELESFASAAGGFDVICLMGVLEHVRDQSALLGRLWRILRPGGTLLLSVPGKHFLSFLDFGNWKFYFPKLHKFFITRTKGEDYYREKFVECRDGLFGDIEVGKNEHQHFKRRELISLIQDHGFEPEAIDGYGMFFRLLHNVWWLTPGPLKWLWQPIIRADLRIGTVAELVMCARRPL